MDKVVGGEPSFSQYEAMVKRIKDVQSANIVGDAQGQITEVHVLSGNKRTAKQIVRDIETLFKVEFALELDHKKISVVQFARDLNIDTMPRLQFKSISFYRNVNSVEINVTLFSPPDNVIKGKAVGFYSRTNRLRLVAEATVSAVQNALREQNQFSAFVEGATLVSLAGRDITLVLLTMISHKRDEQFAGVSIVHDDEKESVVRATLNALNRYVERMLS